MIRVLLLAFLLAGATPVPAATLVELSRLSLRNPNPEFGGLSGLAVSPDGAELAMVSDRGRFVRAKLLRDGQRMTGLDDVRITPILTSRGDPVREKTGDSEGLAPDGTGGFYISFEGLPRIAHHPDAEAKAEAVLRCRDFATLQANSGLEALARGPDGMLYTIPERSGAWKRPFPVYRLQPDGICLEPFYIPRRGAFLVTGADIGPDGRFYVVERDYNLFGFATRIRRFTLEPDGLTDEETLLETPIGALGNMESLSLWRDAEGGLRLLLLADDNFSPLQLSLLIEYRVEE